MNSVLEQQHSLKGLDSVIDWSWLLLIDAAGIFYKKAKIGNEACGKWFTNEAGCVCCPKK
jgi:hypothetical protein